MYKYHFNTLLINHSLLPAFLISGGRGPPTETPWIETPLDRDPPGQRPPQTKTLPGQRPS